MELCHAAAEFRNSTAPCGECVCGPGWAGPGHSCGEDADSDGWADEQLQCAELACSRDNCPAVPNSGQVSCDWWTQVT